MGDRNFKNLSRRSSLREWRGGILYANVNVAANISQPDIAHDRARKQTRFQKNLKAVTNPKNQAATLCKTLHRLHHRRKSRECAGAKIIPVRKTARQNDRVTVR